MTGEAPSTPGDWPAGDGGSWEPSSAVPRVCVCLCVCVCLSAGLCCASVTHEIILTPTHR